MDHLHIYKFMVGISVLFLPFFLFSMYRCFYFKVAPEFENLSDEIYYLKPHMPIRLYCYSRGKPTPTITWYKNGKKLNLNSSL